MSVNYIAKMVLERPLYKVSSKGKYGYIDKTWKEDDIANLMDDDFMGYTLVTLSVGLWAYWHSTSFVVVLRW